MTKELDEQLKRLGLAPAGVEDPEEAGLAPSTTGGPGSVGDDVTPEVTDPTIGVAVVGGEALGPGSAAAATPEVTAPGVTALSGRELSQAKPRAAAKQPSGRQKGPKAPKTTVEAAPVATPAAPPVSARAGFLKTTQAEMEAGRRLVERATAARAAAKKSAG